MGLLVGPSFLNTRVQDSRLTAHCSSQAQGSGLRLTISDVGLTVGISVYGGVERFKVYS